MRLLVAGLSWPPETFICRLLQGLMDAGVEVTVGSVRRPTGGLAANRLLRWLPLTDWYGQRPVWARVGQMAPMLGRAAVCGRRGLTRMAGQVRTASGAGARLKSWSAVLPFVGRQWDVIYFPWNSAAISYLPLFDLGIPTVVSCRGTQIHVSPHNDRRRELVSGLRETFAKASIVHCVSEATKEAAGRYGLDPAKARVIRPGVDPNRFELQPGTRGASNALRVVMTGTLSWVKGYEYALHALSIAAGRGVPVLCDIVGDGNDRQRVLYTIRDLGLEGRVRLHGRLEPDAVVGLLQQADVFLCSSVSEGISNAVLEAMACGVPVITTDCGGMREAVTDRVEGLVVPVRQPWAIAAALERLSGDPNLRGQMGTAARTKVVSQFTLDKHVRDWLALFQEAREMGADGR